jgi:hypothetical protein
VIVASGPVYPASDGAAVALGEAAGVEAATDGGGAVVALGLGVADPPHAVARRAITASSVTRVTWGPGLPAEWLRLRVISLLLL